jgi:hypothetical protein
MNRRSRMGEGRRGSDGWKASFCALTGQSLAR